MARRLPERDDYDARIRNAPVGPNYSSEYAMASRRASRASGDAEMGVGTHQFAASAHREAAHHATHDPATRERHLRAASQHADAAAGPRAGVGPVSLAVQATGRKRRGMSTRGRDDYDARTRNAPVGPNYSEAYAQASRQALRASGDAELGLGTHQAAAAAQREAARLATHDPSRRAEHESRAARHDATGGRDLGNVGSQHEYARRAQAATSGSARAQSSGEHLSAASQHDAAAHAARSVGMHREAAIHTARAGEHRSAAMGRAVSPAGTTRAMHVTQHGTSGHTTPHDQAMHRSVQTGAKGGQFVMTASGRKRYIGKKGR